MLSIKKEGGKLKNEEAIEYLESLIPGQFCTFNIPIYSGEFIASTCMYLGKDDEGRYNFRDDNCFKMSKDFLIRNEITVEKTFDGDKALDIHAQVKKEMDKNNKKKKNRDAR